MQVTSMRLFGFLLVGWFAVGLILYGVASATHPQNPAVFFLIFPAIWIAMVVGGVHSAGFWSFVIGLAITALLYAVLTTGLVVLVSRLRTKRHREQALREN